MTVRRGYHPQEKCRHKPHFGPSWPEVPGSVPMLEYAARMGQERLSGETANRTEKAENTHERETKAN